MSQSSERTKLSNKLTDKYRLIVYNDNTLKEVGFIRLSRLNILAIIGLAIILGAVLIYSLIAYTPAREFIPGYPDGSLKRLIVNNALKIDSLEMQIDLRDKYIHNINLIISGKEPESIDDGVDTSKRYTNLSFKRSIHDSLLRMQIEQEEQFNLSFPNRKKENLKLSELHFFTPVNGIVTNPFNGKESHYGTDVVAGPNEVVKAALDGTVILATWTLETGYTLQIQHDNNIISVYKHNAELLKGVGNRVIAGEAIAIIGNSGEQTTGPHLHFELWHNGRALDPEEFITF